MSSNQNTKFLGATTFSVGTSTVVTVSSSAYQNGWSFKKFSGGTLLIAPGASTSFTGTGYIMGDSESFNIEGPCEFYLTAAGSAVTVHAVISKSSGGS